MITKIPSLYDNHEDQKIQYTFNKIRRILQKLNANINASSKFILLPFTFSDAGVPVISTDLIPAGAIIVQTVVEALTAFDGGATLVVSVNSAPPITIQIQSENNLLVPGIYVVDNWPAATPGSGHAVLTLAGAPTTGTGSVVIEYVPAAYT
jgi:hypothetical protein